MVFAVYVFKYSCRKMCSFHLSVTFDDDFTNTTTSEEPSTSVGAIAGGVIGGLLVIGAVVGVIVFVILWTRKRGDVTKDQKKNQDVSLFLLCFSSMF